MQAELVVREVRGDELSQLIALYAHLHGHDDPLPDRTEVERIWAAIQTAPTQIYMGGFLGTELVSACNAAVVPNLTRGARPFAVIENVVTHANLRRQGIGGVVLRALLQRCWDRNCYKVMLMSGAQRAEVHGFYEALGFDRRQKQAFVITRR